jgi:UDP-2,4-diacetamido-2,4,6-trideoxy-beta-L-altropyranose hydrolase
VPDLLLIRADASTTIGCGHVMRCLALAQAWREAGGTVVFASAELPPAMESRLKSEEMEVAPLQSRFDDVDETITLVRNLDASWIVLDGYRFDRYFQARLKHAGIKLLVIDDIGHAGHYSADLILNQNIHADAAFYVDREPGTKLLLGLQYVLLRREFRNTSRPERAIPERASKLLITLGGSDPCNYTSRVLWSLERNGSFRVRVILGAANPHRAAVEQAICDSGLDVELLTDVRAMNEVIEWADLAIASGGASIWELAFFGVPVVAYSQGPQETMLLQAAEAKGLCIFGGNFTELSAEHLNVAMVRLLPASARREMTQKQQTAVDGQGPLRVIKEMKEYRELRLEC